MSKNSTQDSPTSCSGGKFYTYELPPTVKSIQAGWAGSCQSGAAVSALLAGLAGTLLTWIEPHTYPDSTGQTMKNCLLTISYFAVILNCSATIAPFILMDKLGELPWHATKQQNNLQQYLDIDTSACSQSTILETYGIGKTWPWIVLHWLFCFCSGICCIMLQILLFIYAKEPAAIQVAVTCVTVIAILPLSSLFIVSKRNPSPPYVLVPTFGP